MMDPNEIDKKPAGWWKSLCKFTPFIWLLRSYSSLIMLCDIASFICYSVYEIVQSMIQIIKPPQKKSLKGEIALIIGASRGVGRELCYILSEMEVKIVCIDINSTSLDSTIKIAKTKYGCKSIYGFTCDVTNKEQVSDTIKKIENEIGYISMYFHCCGVPSPRSLVTEPPPIHTTLDVTVVSHFYFLDEILPKMKQNRNGHIVFLTSVAGISGRKHQMPLSVSQFAVQGLFESIVEDLHIEKLHKLINTTIVHIYPFIISDDLAKDIRLRIPSYFGKINANEAAQKILDGVRRNYIEIGIPAYLYYVGHFLKLIPRKASFMFRELLDTGVDFG